MIPKRIFLHCSDTPNGQPCSIKKIKELHTTPKNETVEWFGKKLNGFGWNDVGYHAVLPIDGEIEYGRDFETQGAHCLGENHDSIGICLIGRDKFFTRQFLALTNIYQKLFIYYGIKEHNVFSHYDFDRRKTCPNIPTSKLVYYLMTGDLNVLDEWALF